MDHSRYSPHQMTGKPHSVVALKDLPGLFAGALTAHAEPTTRQITLVFEAPADALWVDAPECAPALRAWLKAASNAHLTIITPDIRVLADAWPRMADVMKWYSHQITALAPTLETSAQLQGAVLDGHSVIYQRRDAPDWHMLPLPRNAVALGIVERMLAYGAAASPQSLGTTGLSA
jgi:hypothetical protein